MKYMFRRTFVLLPLLVIALVIGVVGFKTAYEHKGFFIYHYSLLTNKTYASYQEELLALTKEDPGKALVRYHEILKADPLSYNTCHGIAHQMGHMAYETFGFTKAMSYQDALCGAGFIHGIVEARFGILQERDIVGELPTICDEGNLSCYHGVGHGLMVVTKLNVEQSLSYCDLLPGSVGPRNCYDGVFMHIFDLEESGAAHAAGDASLLPSGGVIAERRAVCEAAQDRYKTSCYFYLPRIFAHAAESKLADLVGLCADVETTYQSTCAAGVGHSTMKYHIADPQVSLSDCTQFPTSGLIGACKEGGLLYYLFSSVTSARGEDPVTVQAAACQALTNLGDQALCRKVTAYRSQL